MLNSDVMVIHNHAAEISMTQQCSYLWYYILTMLYLLTFNRSCPACQLCQARGSLRVAPAAPRMDKTLHLLRFAPEIIYHIVFICFVSIVYCQFYAAALHVL